ncbi:MAG: DUF2142 domain-containing protein [Deltaproteobacteria bacterium]|nr:DUF2142 domain-containing protein [Deltaproteobacteria bacterium]
MDGRLAGWLLFAFAAIFGTGYVVSLPPFGWGDEVPHYLRALRVSEGHLIPHLADGVRGAMVDPGVDQMLAGAAWTTVSWKECTLRLSSLAPLFARRFGNRTRTFTPEYGAPYPPVGSLHIAAAMSFVRLFHPTPLAMLYAARLANLAIWTTLVVVALRLIPALRLTLLAIVAAPTALFVASTCSLDGPLDGLAFLWFALMLRLAVRAEDTPRPVIVASILILGSLLAFIKLAYAPLVFLVLLIPAARKGRPWWRWIAICGGALALGFAAIALWLRLVPLPTSVHFRDPIGGGPTGFDPSRLLENPMGVLAAVPRTIWVEAYPWLINLAWPQWTECLVAHHITVPLVWGALGIALAVDADGFRPTREQRVVGLSVFVGVLVISVLVAFAAWTPGAESRAVGVHGRYLLPALPALGLAAIPPALGLPPRLRSALRVTAVLALVASVALVQIAFIRQYDWGPG